MPTMYFSKGELGTPLPHVKNVGNARKGGNCQKTIIKM
jgi:hypothetical protein